MSLKLQWTVLRQEHVPAKWKAILMVLALIAKDNGTEIFVSVEKLAAFLGQHRVTVGRILQELERAGLVPVIRRGGRWRTKSGKAVGRATVRRIDLEKLATFRCSHVATWSPDHVATSLHDAPDHVATSLRIKKEKILKTD